VHEKIKDAFVVKLVKKVEELKLGRGILSGTTQGLLVNAAAVKKVSAHVKDALSNGGVLVLRDDIRFSLSACLASRACKRVFTYLQSNSRLMPIQARAYK